MGLKTWMFQRLLLLLLVWPTWPVPRVMHFCFILEKPERNPPLTHVRVWEVGSDDSEFRTALTESSLFTLCVRLQSNTCVWMLSTLWGRAADAQSKRPSAAAYCIKAVHVYNEHRDKDWRWIESLYRCVYFFTSTLPTAAQWKVRTCLENGNILGKVRTFLEKKVQTW